MSKIAEVDSHVSVRHGSVQGVDRPTRSAPVDVVRKVALLCVSQCGISGRGAGGPATVHVEIVPMDASQAVHITVCGAGLDDELATGAAITSLVHETLRPTGSIRSVRVTFC